MIEDETARPATDDVVARGERIVLRRKRLADATNDYAWRSDPELARYDAAAPLRIDFRDFLLIFSEDLHHRSPSRHTFAIEDERGRHVGNIMYYNIDRRRRQAELGITIGDRNYWGKGYGSEAVRALVGYIFGNTDLTRVYLNTLKWNERAQRSFEKAGFQPCGRDRRDGYDFVVMEVLREDVAQNTSDGER